MSLFAHAAGLARVLMVGALAALSLPGVQAARAESDLLPPISELFAWNARAEAPPAAPASCSARSEAALGAVQARRQAAMAQIAQLLAASSRGDVEVLNGRGYAYPTNRDPQRELLMVEMEARRQRAANAARGAATH